MFKYSLEIILKILNLLKKNFFYILFIFLIIITSFNYGNIIFLVEDIYKRTGVEELKVYKDLIGIIFSWPVSILIICLIFFVIFKKNIGCLIDRVNRINWDKDGVGIDMSQELLNETSIHLEAARDIVAVEINKETSDNTFKSEKNGSTESAKSLSKIMKLESENERFKIESELNSVAFLNLLLTKKAKEALRKIQYSGGRMSFSDFSSYICISALFDADFESSINTEIEINAITNALRGTGLIESINDKYSITEKGKTFLRILDKVKKN